jgi:hypothetical protein
MTTTVAFVSGIGDVYDDITDAFGRTVSNGWGTTDTGQAWTADGGAASDFAVGSGVGTLTLTSVSVSRRPNLASMQVTDSDQTVTITVPAVATGGSMSAGLLARYTDTSNHLRAELVFDTAGNFIVRVVQASTSGGVQVIANSATISSYTAASSWKIRARVVGQWYRAKAWAAASSEPDDWDVYGLITDATMLATVGAIGIRATREAGNTNVNPIFSFDNYAAGSAVDTRLNLNTAPWNLVDRDTDLSPPELRYATASTLLSDGSITSAGSYEDRVIRLGLQLSSSDGGADELQALWRELDRPRNWLLWQPAGHEPVFFHTKRAGPDQIREVVGNGDLREIMVEIPADSGGYGPMQMIPAVTVTNDPAAGSNGCYLDIDGSLIK